MKTWLFDVGLVEDLFKVCRIPVSSVLEKHEISSSTWNGWRNAERNEKEPRKKFTGGIPLPALVAFCNEMCVPVHKVFICQGSEPTYPLVRENFARPRREFVPMKFDEGKFFGMFRKRSGLGLTVTEMVERIGCNYTVYCNWKKNLQMMRVAYFVGFCNEFGFSPEDFFVEDNPKVYSIHEERITVAAEAEFPHPAMSLEEKNEKLSERITALNEENEGLKRECRELAIENMELKNEIHRLKQHIETMENVFPGMTAKNNIPG